MNLQAKSHAEVDYKIGNWNGFFRVITSPLATFTELVKSPRTWLPCLYLGLTAFIFTFPFYAKYFEYAKLTFANSLSLTPNGQPMAAELLNTMLKTQTMASILGVAMSPVLGSLVLASLLKLLNLIMGEEVTFKKLWTIAIFAQVPVVIGLLVKNLLLVSATGDNLSLTFLTSLSFAAFAPRNSNILVVLFLNMLNIFTVWKLILIIIGLSQAIRSTYIKVGTVVFTTYFTFSFLIGYLTRGSLERLFS